MEKERETEREREGGEGEREREAHRIGESPTVSARASRSGGGRSGGPRRGSWDEVRSERADRIKHTHTQKEIERERERERGVRDMECAVSE